MDASTDVKTGKHVEITVDIVSAYISNNSVPTADLARLIASVHQALSSLGTLAAPADDQVVKPTPVQVRKSITPDGLISFVDGKSYKSLKRHLSGKGLDPRAYREKFGLPTDYPMVASSYSAQRSALAKSIGLGQASRKAESKVAAAEK